MESRKTLKITLFLFVIYTLVAHSFAYPEHSLNKRASPLIVSSNLCDPNVKQFSGYIEIEQGSALFFWFFESRNNPETSPVTLWLNGGPGASSMFGIFHELGPCKMNIDGTTANNIHSFSESSNLLFVDQPVGTGFSFGNKYVDSTKVAAQDLYNFLQLWFTEFPQYSELDFHIFGDSYGGHYVPVTAREIYEGNELIKNNNTEGININLKSIMIGSGFINPVVHYESHPDLIENFELLEPQFIQSMRDTLPACVQLYNKCYETNSSEDCSAANAFCFLGYFGTFANNSGLNMHDFRMPIETSTLWPPIADFSAFLNQEEVKTAIGAQKDFSYVNETVFLQFGLSGDTFEGGSTANTAPDIEFLLSNDIRVLLHYGDREMFINWAAGLKIADGLKWKNQQQFINSKVKLWKVKNCSRSKRMDFLDNKRYDQWSTRECEAGQVKQFNNLMFVKIFEAGHFNAFYQPEYVLDLYTKWINNIKI
jgi:carboxypeptidase C (cathepsin A)